MQRLNIAVLVDNEILVPGTTRLKRGQGERYVVRALKRLARRVTIQPYTGVQALTRWIEETRPDVVFNMTEHAGGDRNKDSHITALLDLHGLAYTGPGPKGLMLCRDKALSKLVAQREGFHVPQFFLVGAERVPSSIRFPLVVKPRFGDSSDGITQQSLVTTNAGLRRRIDTLGRAGVEDIICEEYVEGREMLVSLVGRRMLPVRELVIGRNGANGTPRIFSSRLKHDREYQKRWSVRMKFAHLSAEEERRLERIALRTASALELRDYGRIDVKLSPRGDWVFLEANPNPALVPFERSFSGAWSSVDYDTLIAQITRGALRRKPAES